MNQPFVDDEQGERQERLLRELREESRKLSEALNALRLSMATPTAAAAAAPTTDADGAGNDTADAEPGDNGTEDERLGA